MTESTDINWYSEEAATFGDRLSAAREAQSLTQAGLAKRLGVATRTLDAWENDISEPRANKLQMLSGVLNVSMRWLLTGEGDGVEQAEAQIADNALTEMRTLRAEMLRMAEKLALLEKQMRKAQTVSPVE